MATRAIRWIAGVFLTTIAVIILLVLAVVIFGGKWLPGVLERMASEQTGRVLAIDGDLQFRFGWPLFVIHSGAVTFANPDWAREKQMLSADAVDIAIDLPRLFRREINLAEVRFERPVIFLEQGSNGRKNWLLDINQQDEGARLNIKRLTLDQGKVGYDDAGQKTSLRAEITTGPTPRPGSELAFSVRGQYLGLPAAARGNGGPVLGLRDEVMPYPLQAEFSVGHTVVKVAGTITSLLRFSALDLRLALSGKSLAEIYPLLGIAFPSTPAYATAGHLTHSGHTWRYENFSGRIGNSDIAGNLQVDSGGKRPTLKADLVSRVLDFADLGPLIGARPGRVQAARQAAETLPETSATTPARARVLPDLPFASDRWGSVDAEVTLKAGSIRSERELPLDNLVTRLTLHDSLLKLDPLDFGVAGGHLNAVIALDGRQQPLHARARIQARKILLARLFPTVDPAKMSAGQINGQFDLEGRGNSVGSLLASANGKVGLVVNGGQISRLLMEQAGLHLWEILELKIAGDRPVKLRCAVVDFDVKQGVMHTEALVLDTEVTTLITTGSIDLGQETLDLTLNQRTKTTSPLALRSPIHVRGHFASPDVEVDKGYIAARTLGAVALGIVNPFLALLPLIDAGPGRDSDCRELVREARATPAAASAAKVRDKP